MIGARARFSKGQRVVSTPAAERLLLWSAPAQRTGVVVGFGRIGRESGADNLVRVRLDGQTGVHTYHMDFWEAAE